MVVTAVRCPCKRARVVPALVALLRSLPAAAPAKAVLVVRLSSLQARETRAVILRSRVAWAVLVLAALCALPLVAAHWAVAAATCSSLQAQIAKASVVKHACRVVAVARVAQWPSLEAMARNRAVARFRTAAALAPHPQVAALILRPQMVSALAAAGLFPFHPALLAPRAVP